MSHFTYRVRDNKGLAVDGVMEAPDEGSVIANLHALGYKILHIKTQGFSLKRLWEQFRKSRKISQQDIILFARQISTMLKSGLPITTSLASVAQQCTNERLSHIVKTIRRDVETGSSFSKALSKHPKVFSELFVSMVKVGETAGILGPVLDRLVAMTSQEHEVRVRVQSAMIYPLILISIALVIVVFLLVAIIPKFVTIFESYDTKLPLATQFLLWVSDTIIHSWYVILVVIGAGVFWLKNFLKTEQGLYKYHSTLLKTPIIGTFLIKVIVSRFSRILGVLIKSGITILDALAVTERTVNNVVISRVIQDIRSAVAGGKPLSEPFKTCGIFPEMVVQMVAAGEKSGKLDQMLVDVAAYYDQEVDYTLKNLSTIIEPLMLCVMGGIVGFIALAVLTPVFNLVKVFKGG